MSKYCLAFVAALVLPDAIAFQLVPARTRPLAQQAILGRSMKLSPLQAGAKGRFMDEIANLDEDDEDMGTAVAAAAPATAAKAASILDEEIVFWEGAPSWTEMVVPGLSIITVIGLVPFAAAVARQAWVRYKFTSRRVSVASGVNGNDVSQIVYSDITEVRYVKRAAGSGDMVISLRDGAKLEMRHVPEFQKIYKYVQERISDEAAEASFGMTYDDEEPLPASLMPDGGVMADFEA